MDRLDWWAREAGWGRLLVFEEIAKRPLTFVVLCEFRQGALVAVHPDEPEEAVLASAGRIVGRWGDGRVMYAVEELKTVTHHDWAKVVRLIQLGIRVPGSSVSELVLEFQGAEQDRRAERLLARARRGH